METRNLTNYPHWLLQIEALSQTKTCPTCQDKTNWKWGDVFQFPFIPGGPEAKNFAVLTCVCGYTLLVQPTPENGLKFSR
jgi:hypothetical protein